MPEFVSVFIYRVFLCVYPALIRMAALFHPKAKRWVSGRKGLFDRLRSDFARVRGERPVAWFHAASLGEFEQGRPVIESFARQFPEYCILLTFFSPSGYEVRKNYGGAHYICYLPVDGPGRSREFVRIVKPEIAYFIKYEFWHYYVKELREQQAGIVSFSAIFREDQLFFKPYGGFYREILRRFDSLLVQNPESVELLRGIGLTQAACAGDTRYDRVSQIASAARELPEIARFVNDGECLIVGSAWPEDMEVVIPAVNVREQPLKLIVAPHEIRDREMTAWTEALKGRSLRYSEYAASGFSPALAAGADCLFIDNIGMLSSLYRYGTVAFIGGGFGNGLHNILEAVTFGLPVVFGNRKYRKFQEATDLAAAGVAFPVADTAAFSAVLARLSDDPAGRARLGDIGRRFVAGRTGATEKVIGETVRLLGARFSR